ncbi:MAG: ABC transporter permease [Candidatus Puniceispirillaceae bacterium]
MLNWLSFHRADIAAFVIIGLVLAFIWSIYVGRRETAARETDEVFGDPERTKGGWYWAVCGMSALLLVWFYFSWGMGRAYFPQAANELCQIGKLNEAVSPIRAALPIESRYYKSTDLVVRNSEQLDELLARMPENAFTQAETRQLTSAITNSKSLLAIYSNPVNLSTEAETQMAAIASQLGGISDRLRDGADGLQVSDEALNQPPWGVTEDEIPLLPTTAKGVLFDTVSIDAKQIAGNFAKIRNMPSEAESLIATTKDQIASLKDTNKAGNFDDATAKARNDYVKAVERIFRRLDDGLIFPASAMIVIHDAIDDLSDATSDAKGGLKFVDALFLPGEGVVKSRTICTEQGSARWLPKPGDVIATFGRLANPDIASGGGYKGTTLLWWKWLAIADVVDFFIPDGLVDMLPGDYASHQPDGSFTPNYKDNLLAFAQGEVYLGSVPMLDGHIWDSLFRVLVALSIGILLGVPLGIYMGVSRFFKSFFDPMIELYRPVPPLAWAPLILTIFGIQDDGKIFLLFMVAFAIMVISARTGASGTQLSKIRASHSLGATNQQILRNVILPNALPEILTGARIAIGVCWGTLVAAEMLAGTTGIGFIENVARTVSDYELIWVTILIMGLLGLAFDMFMRLLIAKLIPWRGKG